MKQILRLLNVLLLLLALFLAWQAFKGNRDLKEATRLINKVSADLTAVKDSVERVQNSIQSILNRVELAGYELKILKNERDMLEAEVEKRLSKDFSDLQTFKKNIQDMKKKNEKLEQEAGRLER